MHRESDLTRLREVRKRLGWTQRRLAVLLQVTSSTISRWERARQRPSRCAATAWPYSECRALPEEAATTDLPTMCFYAARKNLRRRIQCAEPSRACAHPDQPAPPMAPQRLQHASGRSRARRSRNRIPPCVQLHPGDRAGHLSLRADGLRLDPSTGGGNWPRPRRARTHSHPIEAKQRMWPRSVRLDSQQPVERSMLKWV